MLYYQVNRTIAEDYLSPEIPEPHQFYQFHGYDNAFARRICDFHDFFSWFRLQEDLENEKKIKVRDFNAVNNNLEVIRKALTMFLNGFTNANFSALHVERNPGELNLNFRASTESSLVITKNGQSLRIQQLSAGEQMVLLLVGDIARRLAIANPGLEDALQGKGIVLIDEIELHLHPQWQREVLPALQRTFPKLQFIVTTHSPQVLSNVERENVFILEDFNVVEVTPYTKGRDSNSILYELQGVEERPAPFKEKLRTLYRLIDGENIAAAKAALQELSEQWGEHDTEIVRAKMHLNLLSQEQ